MDLNFEYRKRCYNESIAEEYSPKKRKWWQEEQPSFILTKDYAEKNYRSFNIGDQVVVKNSIAGAVILSIFFIVILIIAFFTSDDKIWFYILTAIGLILARIYLPGAFTKKDQLRINKEEVWYYKKFVNLKWSNVLSSYIKIVNEAEDKTYSLIIHYYDDTYDEFRSLEIDIQELEISVEEITAIVEKFKTSSTY